MSKIEELNDRQIIRIQAEMNLVLRNALDDIRTIAKDSLRFASENGYKPSQAMIRVQEKAERALSKLDTEGAKLDHIKKGILPREQQRLLT